VTRGGLVFQSLAAVDLDALHGYLLYTLDGPSFRTESSKTDQSYHVYVIQGCGQRDYSDRQAALAHVPRG